MRVDEQIDLVVGVLVEAVVREAHHVEAVVRLDRAELVRERAPEVGRPAVRPNPRVVRGEVALDEVVLPDRVRDVDDRGREDGDYRQGKEEVAPAAGQP